MVQWKQIRLGTMRLWVRSLVLLRGLTIWRCRELWCRSQTQLGSRVAMAVVQAISCSSDLTLSLGTSEGVVLKKQTKTKNKQTKNNSEKYQDLILQLLPSLIIYALHLEIKLYKLNLQASLSFFSFLFFFFFGLLRAAPVAYRDSQARGQIGALAVGLHTVILTPDLSHVCDLHHSSQQHRILNPLSEARDQTCVLMDASQIHFR